MSSYVCDLAERFEAMRRQEDVVHLWDEYLSAESQKPQLQETFPVFEPAVAPAPLSTVLGESSSSSSSSFEGVFIGRRSKICSWCYQVVDHFDFDREIVYVTLSYLDRFCEKTVDKRTFQLVATTSLFIACKRFEPNKLRMPALIELSRGYFTAEHVKATEDCILKKLPYLERLPTPLRFQWHLIRLLPGNCCARDVKVEIEKAARFMIELSVYEYSFVPMRNSSIGLAAVLNALDDIDESRLSVQSVEEFLDNVRNFADLDPTCEEVKKCRKKLRALYYRDGCANQEHQEDTQDADRGAGRITTVPQVSVAARVAAGIGAAEMGPPPIVP